MPRGIAVCAASPPAVGADVSDALGGERQVVARDATAVLGQGNVGVLGGANELANVHLITPQSGQHVVSRAVVAAIVVDGVLKY